MTTPEPPAMDVATARDLLLHPGGYARSLLALAADVLVRDYDRLAGPVPDTGQAREPVMTETTRRLARRLASERRGRRYTHIRAAQANHRSTELLKRLGHAVGLRRPGYSLPRERDNDVELIIAAALRQRAELLELRYQRRVDPPPGDTAGRCGDMGDLLFNKRYCCELRAGHAGWHREGVTEWSGVVAHRAASEVQDTGQARPHHLVTSHWDAAGGEVLYRSCTCGEEWARDEDRCPVDDIETLAVADLLDRLDLIQARNPDEQRHLDDTLDALRRDLAKPSGDTVQAAVAAAQAPESPTDSTPKAGRWGSGEAETATGGRAPDVAARCSCTATHCLVSCVICGRVSYDGGCPNEAVSDREAVLERERLVQQKALNHYERKIETLQAHAAELGRTLDRTAVALSESQSALRKATKAAQPADIVQVATLNSELRVRASGDTVQAPDVAALLRFAAAGRREYATNAPADQATALESAAATFDQAARIASGDVNSLRFAVPSWRWDEADALLGTDTTPEARQ